MCRNYRELSTAEVGEIARLYPVTTNREIARMYDISVDALQDYLAYPNGWTKDRKAVLIGNRGGQSLTDKQVQQLIDLCRSLEGLDAESLKNRVVEAQETIRRIGEAKDKAVSFYEKLSRLIQSASGFLDKLKTLFGQ